MNVADSSVVVAGFASWHESHAAARRALDGGARLVAHVALEAYSVLTRLPAPHRAPAPLVVEFLQDRFPDPPLLLGPEQLGALPARLVSLGITGGAAYDGLVALTASAHGATLLTLDRRAEEAYRKCGVRYRLI